MINQMASGALRIELDTTDPTMFRVRLPRTVLLNQLRGLHTERGPNYKGWWTLVLEQPLPSVPNDFPPEKNPPPDKTPAADNQATTASKKLEDEHPAPQKPPGPDYVTLPIKPEPPDNCCMSVWDIYNESLQEYRAELVALRNRLAGERNPIPDALLQELGGDPGGGGVADGMDPGMRAFLELEKKEGKGANGRLGEGGDQCYREYHTHSDHRTRGVRYETTTPALHVGHYIYFDSFPGLEFPCEQLPDDGFAVQTEYVVQGREVEGAEDRVRDTEGEHGWDPA
ncbi:hypothetical protein BC938DRAFT_480412 [Jimgerdemannia flammicorona]|uniref:Oxidoreductase-like domain-containing protein n=1 Tax=Jimgerdemannia flammicorona TaxID=994334 RepID=A0A433QJ55_9FUNG|nr:hypothetical protein BC938DRAFT_480412 [Jimgerdemannia flammicorona]